jgi:hypothetical protein
MRLRHAGERPNLIAAIAAKLIAVFPAVRDRYLAGALFV